MCEHTSALEPKSNDTHLKDSKEPTAILLTSVVDGFESLLGALSLPYRDGKQSFLVTVYLAHSGRSAGPATAVLTEGPTASGWSWIPLEGSSFMSVRAHQLRRGGWSLQSHRLGLIVYGSSSLFQFRETKTPN